jgi:hypothetical protein
MVEHVSDMIVSALSARANLQHVGLHIDWGGKIGQDSMKTPKATTSARRQRELLLTEIERVIMHSKRILSESKADVRRIRRELAHVLR